MSAVMPDGQGLAREPADAGSVPLRKPASVTPAPLADPTLSPVERLEASRARLRGALLEIAHPPAPPPVDGLLGDLKDKFLRVVRDLPGATIVMESVESWWAQHPLRTAGIVAREASQEFVVPFARRSPFLLLLGATVAGALLAATRPWRWLIRPALFVGLVPQLASHALRRMPIDTWMHLATRMMSGRPSRTDPRSPAPATAPPHRSPEH